MGGYVAGRRVVINNVTYNAGDTVPLAELMPFYFKNLVRRGNLTEEQVDGVDEAALNAAVSAAVDALVDGAPAALDTLNEIAAAIGDDGSFATSVVLKADTDVSTYGFVVDEDDMVSNDATKLPTQQSVKAYVDANGGGGSIDDLSDAGVDAVNDNLYIGATIPGTASGATNNIAISGDGTALDALTSGDNNIAIGDGALSDNATSSEVVAVGSLAGAGSTAAAGTFVGYNARSTSAAHSSVTAIGHDAVASTGGVAVGKNSDANNGVSIGLAAHGNTNCVAVGNTAGFGVTGSDNTLIGHWAGYNVLTTGADNTLVGSGVNTDVAARNDTVVIGSGMASGAEDGSIAIGSNSVPGNVLRVESGVLTIGGVKWVSLSTLQTETAAATDFTDFKVRIAALT